MVAIIAVKQWKSNCSDVQLHDNIIVNLNIKCESI